MTNHPLIQEKLDNDLPVKLNLGSGNKSINPSFLDFDIRKIRNVDIVWKRL